MLNYQYLIEIDALNASHVATTCRFCCQPGFSGGGHTWEPRIVDPGYYSSSLFSGSTVTGKSSFSFGEIILGNFKSVNDLSGPTDYLRDYTFYGKQVRMWMGPYNGTFPTDFKQVYTAVIDGTSIDEETVSFTLRGPQAELDIPFETGIFLGNNVAPNGVEGIASQKDQRKPGLLGRAFNIAPVLCNQQRLIYAVSPITGLSVPTDFNSGFQVFDDAVELYCDKVVDTSAELMYPNTTALPGKYIVSRDGYIQLGSSPSGQVTCSCASAGMALNAHPETIIRKIFELADATPGRTHASFVDMLDDQSFVGFEDVYERGIYLQNSSETISSMIDRLVAPCGYWYFTPLRKIRFRTIKLSGYDPAVYTAESHSKISNFKMDKMKDTKGGVPANKVTLKCGRNYTVQSTVAGSVDILRAQRLSTEWLSYSLDSDGFVFPLSEPFETETALFNTTNFENGYPLGGTLRAMVCKTHDLLTIKLNQIEFLNTYDIELGAVISVDLYGRFGYTGKDMLLINKTPNFVDEEVEFILWEITGR